MANSRLALFRPGCWNQRHGTILMTPTMFPLETMAPCAMPGPAIEIWRMKDHALSAKEAWTAGEIFAMGYIREASFMGRNPERSLQLIRRALRLLGPKAEPLEYFRRSSGNIHAQLGLELYQQGRIDASTKAYRQALAQDAHDSRVWNNLGWNLYLTGNLTAAITAYRRALTEDSNSIAQFNLGLAYLVQGNIDSADAAYARGVAGFGAEDAEKNGVTDDLRELVTRGVQAGQASRLLETYWNP